MTDTNVIRVIPFCSKVVEWDIWSKRFLSKAKGCGFKYLLLEKLSIPKLDEEIDETSDIGKKKSMIIELNEIAYTKLILLIDFNASTCKIVFNIIKGYKTKSYSDGNGTISWKRLKNKYKPSFTPSIVKLEKKFRELSLKKGQDSKIWTAESKDLRVKLENMALALLKISL
jgi:hypothetical protein